MIDFDDVVVKPYRLVSVKRDSANIRMTYFARLRAWRRCAR